MSEEKEWKLELDERVFNLLSHSLYGDRRAFIREMIQNAYDAGATRIDIEVSADGKTVTIKDNGKGMSYEFVKKDFKRVGKQFKPGDITAGFYGVGRLSLWHGGLGTKRVVYITSTGEEATELIWDSLKVGKQPRRLPNVLPRGTTIKLEISKKITPEEIIEYINEKIYLPIEINVNGASAGNREVLKGKGIEGVVKDNDGNPKRFVYYFDPDKRDLIILEKGFLVGKVSCSVGGYVDFKDPVKTLSREEFNVNNMDMRDAILDILYEKIFPKLSRSQLEQLNLTILNMMDWSYRWRWKGIEKMKKYLIFNGKSLEELEREKGIDKILYHPSAASNPKVQRAIEEGYVVLMGVFSGGSLLEKIGIRDIREVPNEELARTVVHKKIPKKYRPAIEKTSEMLDEIQGAFRSAVKKMREYEESGLISKSLGEKIITNAQLIESKEKEKKKEIPLQDEVIEERTEKDIIKSGFITITVGYNDNPETIAWSVGNTISLNLNNELVRVCLEKNRVDLLEEPLTHEYVHQLGIKGHGEDFTATYNLIRMEMLLRKAKKSEPVKVKRKRKIPNAPWKVRRAWYIEQVLKGRSYEEIIKDAKEKFNLSDYRAERDMEAIRKGVFDLYGPGWKERLKEIGRERGQEYRRQMRYV